MLLELQQQLTDIYQVDRCHDVRDYLITDPTMAKYLGQEALLGNTDETLLVAQDDDGLAVSLFLDSELLKRLESADPLNRLRAGLLDDLWKVLEGIGQLLLQLKEHPSDATVLRRLLERRPACAAGSRSGGCQSCAKFRRCATDLRRFLHAGRRKFR